MEIFIYSDESGVFDKTHNKYYVYAGLIFLSKEEKDICVRKYRTAEKAIAKKYPQSIELKGSVLKNADKGKLFRSLNQNIKFATLINQERVLDSIFCSKKSKQRYLDYAYKIGLKNTFKQLEREAILTFEDIKSIRVFVDEHTTATDGLYELRESLLQEFKYGTYNWNYSTFFPPIFPNLEVLDVKFCNSCKTPLVRAADIIANRIYHNVLNDKDIYSMNNMYITQLP